MTETLGRGSGASGNDARVKDAQARARGKQKAADEALRKVLATDDGKAVFWHLLSEAGIFHSTFSSDALVSAFRQGKREFGLQIYEWLRKVAEPDYQAMEAAAWKRQYERADDPDPAEGASDVQ